MLRDRTRVALVLATFAAALSAPVLADPPAHAPAHGWRKKHDPDYVGYTGVKWTRDYEIRSGRCNREAVATVLGGAVGGAIAARVAEPENRTIATLIGTAAGALIGNRIGRKLDEADRGCFAHALEIGDSGRVVTWTNGATGVRYEMTPGAEVERDGAACRRFRLVSVVDGRRAAERGIACAAEAGAWRIL